MGKKLHFMSKVVNTCLNFKYDVYNRGFGPSLLLSDAKRGSFHRQCQVDYVSSRLAFKDILGQFAETIDNAYSLQQNFA